MRINLETKHDIGRRWIAGHAIMFLSMLRIMYIKTHRFQSNPKLNIPIPERKSKIHRIHNLTITRSSENHERMYKLL